MTFTLDMHGDPLERAFATIIAAYTPSYQKIWAQIVGNDGHSQLPVIAGLGAADTLLRAHSSQCLYSVLESTVGADLVVQDVSKFAPIDLASEDGPTAYLRLGTLWLGFWAHVGRIRDLVITLGELWGLPDLGSSLNEYYQRRNVAMHAAGVPGWFIEGALAVLPLEGATPDWQTWGASRLWCDADVRHAELITDYLAETHREMRSKTNDALERLYSLAVAPRTSSWRYSVVPPSTGYSPPPPLTSGHGLYPGTSPEQL
jgi:hypothetical protein